MSYFWWGPKVFNLSNMRRDALLNQQQQQQQQQQRQRQLLLPPAVHIRQLPPYFVNRAMSGQPPHSPVPPRVLATVSPISPAPSTPSAVTTPIRASPVPANKLPVVTLGVCAMDAKARSKAMREILTRLVENERGGVDVKIFGDVVILEEGE